MASDKFKILILSTDPEERLIEEIAKANETAENGTTIIGEVVNPLDFMLKITKHDLNLQAFRRFSPDSQANAEIMLDQIPQFDAIISRLENNRAGQFGRDVIRHFQLMGTYSTASAYALETCLNSFKINQLLAKDRWEKIPVKTSVLMNSPANLKPTLNLIGGVPVAGRISTGQNIIGDVLLKDPETALTVLQSINNSEAEIIISPNIETGLNEIEKLKIIVINPYSSGQKTFAYKIRTPFDYKSQKDLDGIFEPVELTATEISICNRAARILELDFAEITLIRDIRNDNYPETTDPYIIEVSGNPSIKNAETALPAANIAKELIDSVIQILRQKNKTPKASDINTVRRLGLPADFARNITKIAKYVRMAARDENRSFTNSEFEVIRIAEEMLEEIKVLQTPLKPC